MAYVNHPAGGEPPDGVRNGDARGQSRITDADDITGQGDNGQRVELTFGEALTELGHDGTKFVSIGFQAEGRGFWTKVMPAAEAVEYVFGYLAHCDDWRGDTYFSVNAVVADRCGGGRGTEADVVVWCAVYGDFDVKPGAFASIDDALVCIAAISAMLGTRPSVLIFSGHGIQPLWPIEDGVLDTESKWQRAARLSRQSGRLMAEVAWRNHQAGMDSVFDLSRMLRVPGTFNCKNTRHIVMAYGVADTGAPLTVDQIEEALDEWGTALDVPELASDFPVRGEVVSAPSDWTFAAADCNYVTAMVSRWGTDSDRPKAGRHQWACDRAVRLACAQRLGCVTEDGLAAAKEHLETALAHWCQVVGVPRALHRKEIDEAWRWGADRASKLSEAEARAQLGGHTHDSKDPFGIRSKPPKPERIPLGQRGKYQFQQGVS